MNDVARAKQDMFDAFVNKELGEGGSSGFMLNSWLTVLFFTELRILLQGCIPDVPEEEPVPEKKRSKKIVIVDDKDCEKLPETGGRSSSMAFSEEEPSFHQSDMDVSSDGLVWDPTLGKTPVILLFGC